MGNRELGGIALSPQGTVLMFSVKNVEDKTPLGIYRIDLDLKTIDFFAAGVFEDLSFSPDGESLLATEYDGDKSDIVLIDIAGAKMTKLTTDGKSSKGAWFPMKGFETVHEDDGHEHHDYEH